MSVEELQAEAQRAPLPPNWEAAVDRNSGKLFYRNVVTRQTQWEHPGLPQQAVEQPQQQQQAAAAAGGAFNPFAFAGMAGGGMGGSAATGQGSAQSTHDRHAAALFNPQNLQAQMAGAQKMARLGASGKSGFGMLRGMFSAGSDEEDDRSAMEVMMGKQKTDKKLPGSMWEYVRYEHTILSIIFVREDDLYTRKRRLAAFLSITLFALFMSTTTLSATSDPTPEGVQVLLQIIVGLMVWGYSKVMEWAWEASSNPNNFCGLILTNILKWRLFGDAMSFLISLIIMLTVSRSFGSFMLQWFLSELWSWLLELLYLPPKYLHEQHKQKEKEEAKREGNLDEPLLEG